MGLMAIMIDGTMKGNLLQIELCLTELTHLLGLIAFHRFFLIREEFISLFKMRFLPIDEIPLPKEGISIGHIAAYNIIRLSVLSEKHRENTAK